MTIKKDYAAELGKYAGIPRRKLPWLKGHLNSLDCAAAVTYTFDFKELIWSCGVLMGYLKGKHMWHTTGIPERNDIVIISWRENLGMGKNKGHDHTGIVEKADKRFVYYTSADSTLPLPGLVTVNHKVPYAQVTGYGRIK
jgi:hypothetical protein